MKRDPLDEAALELQGRPRRDDFLGGSGRVTAGLVAIALGTLAGLIFRLAHAFLDDVGWLALIVRLVLDELALTTLLFAVALLIWSAFAPDWLYRPLEVVYRKLNLWTTWLAYLICSVMGAFLLIGLIILAYSSLVQLLSWFGILR
jgi:hypothetical protein